MADLLYTISEGVGRVTFNRPDARNAFTFDMYERLAEICRTAPTDGAVKAIILTGAGDRAFAAGTDIAAFRSVTTPSDALAYEARIDRVLDAVERCPVPTIAAIAGACTGGGAAIAAACDLRIADSALKFGFPIARTLGNCLSIGNLNRVGALIGFGRLREILFTARLIDAEEARAIGLICDVAPDAAALRARADALAERVAGHAPLTLRATKEGLRRLRVDGPNADGGDLVAETYMSADFREGLEAFLAKRKPQWRGE